MTKEELVKFLSDNLKVDVNLESAGYWDRGPRLSVSISLCGEEITESKITMSFSDLGSPEKDNC